MTQDEIRALFEYEPTTTRALDINAHGPGYPVVFRPAALSDPAIKEAAVVVSPIRA